MDAIKRLKFWIALGLLVVVSGVVLGVWFVPARKQSATTLSDWRSKEKEVESYGGRTDVRGPADVDALKTLQEGYEQQRAQARELLEEWDKLLEDYIPDDDGSRHEMEGGEWKFAYAARMDALEEDVQSSFPSAPENVVTRVDFGAAWATQEEMVQEAKRYWVQRYLLDAIMEVNKVSDVIPRLKGFHLIDRPDRLLSADDATMFRPIAFEFQFATEFTSVPMVLQKLLECRVPVAVTTVSVKRRGRVSLGVKKEAGTTGGLLSASAVTARVGVPGMTGVVPGAYGPMSPMMERPPIFADRFISHGPVGEEVSRAGRAATTPRFDRGRTPAGQPRSGAAPAARKVRLTPEQAEAGRLLVDVVVKGYVKDYVPPAEDKPADEAA